MAMQNIRNFVITAHIDSGKSTLADRLLETTGTVANRLMRPQYLDQLSLERERGITIKMAPVRMVAKIRNSKMSGSDSCILNLIDTPGHSDFSYEVSRALAAVEGAILLVDATQGIQAQTLANYRHAKAAGLKILGAVNKIDVDSPIKEKIVRNLANFLNVDSSEILRVSAKTGEGVENVVEKIIEDIPGPPEEKGVPRALIFDSVYNDHKGVIAYVRMFGGSMKSGDELYFMAEKHKFTAKEVGYFSPEMKVAGSLGDGEIGYIATGIKEPALVRIGDTVVKNMSQSEALQGYREPNPVIFVSFYPLEDTTFEDLRQALGRLRLNDAALNFEPETNEVLGRGFKVGFLGQLHFEITASRLEREFGMRFSTSLPSVAYRVRISGKEQIIKQPSDFPENPEKTYEPIIRLEIIVPPQYFSQVLNVASLYDLTITETSNMGDDLVLTGEMPLAELMRGFDNSIKSASAGYASFSYELIREREADVEKLEILVNGETVPALSRIIPRKDIEREARNTVERLKEALPRQQFSQALQGKARGRIISRETIPALRKDVTGYLYGGDRTRKMKLWKKQQKGKKKLLRLGRVEISPEVIRQILKK